MTTWQSIAILMISLAILVRVISPFFKQVDNSPEKARAMQLKREEVCKIYPSNISMRGYINSPDNAYDENDLVYIVAEINNLYIISEKNMQLKFEIPINNIIEAKQIFSSKNLRAKTTMHIPTVVTYDIYTIFLIKYIDFSKTTELYLFSDEAVSKYNEVVSGRYTVFAYIKKLLRERNK